MSAIIDELVALIRQARYGRDVRESIAHGIEVIDDVAEGARDSATASATAAQGYAQVADQSASNAQTSENNAGASATIANDKATLAESWAVGGTSTRTGEDTNNAKYWAEQAEDEAEIAGENSEAWAVGTRGGQPVPSTDPAYDNHAKYWAEQAHTSVTGVTSWKGRTGDISPLTGDYNLEQIGSENMPQGYVAIVGANGHMTITPTGLANGIAGLDANGRVPSTQLPSYVDDVLEYASLNDFPATGESGKIYVALDTNKTYRWSGTAYVEISESLALGETASTAYAGNKGKANADAIDAIKDGTDIESFGDVESALDDKVDKVSGKGLSTNDYTTAEKTKLSELSPVEANPSSTATADLTKLKVDDTTYDIQGGHIIRNESGTALAQRKSMQFNNCTITDDPTNNKTIVKPDAPLVVEKTYAQYLADKQNLDASGDLIKITDQGVTNNAIGTAYDNTQSGLTAGNVQGAIDEINSSLSANRFPSLSGVVDISGYTSSNRYTIPSDGYIHVNKGELTSGVIAVDIRGSIYSEVGIILSIDASTPIAYAGNCCFVRKGMQVYTASFVQGGYAQFIPLLN